MNQKKEQLAAFVKKKHATAVHVLNVITDFAGNQAAGAPSQKPEFFVSKPKRLQVIIFTILFSGALCFGFYKGMNFALWIVILVTVASLPVFFYVVKMLMRRRLLLRVTDNGIDALNKKFVHWNEIYDVFHVKEKNLQGTEFLAITCKDGGVLEIDITELSKNFESEVIRLKQLIQIYLKK